MFCSPFLITPRKNNANDKIRTDTPKLIPKAAAIGKRFDGQSDRGIELEWWSAV